MRQVGDDALSRVNYVHIKNDSEKMSFLCSRIPQKLYWFAIISWFTSLNRIFIWLSNDNKLEYILPIPYSKLLKKIGAV